MGWEAGQTGSRLEHQCPPASFLLLLFHAVGHPWSFKCIQTGSSSSFFAPSPDSATEPSWLLSRTHDLGAMIHRYLAVFKKVLCKNPEMLPYFLISEKLPLSQTIPSPEHKAQVSIPSGKTQENPLVTEEGLGRVRHLLILELLILAIKPRAIDNPLEKECPKILSVRG